MDDMDVDMVSDMPGGENFRNVTSVFSNAAKGQYSTAVEPQNVWS
jgi:hypothetical protein